MGARLAPELMEFVSKEIQVETSFDLQLVEFFKALQPIGAEFGYRTANEMKRLIYLLGDLALDKDESALDVAVIQKLLPKLNGSRSKLIKVLPILATFCLQKNISNKSEFANSILEDYRKNRNISTENDKLITLKYSFAKIARMYVSASENGFASFAEG
jgi:hypothetical protein